MTKPVRLDFIFALFSWFLPGRQFIEVGFAWDITHLLLYSQEIRKPAAKLRCAEDRPAVSWM
jgi:hypothetical protein